MLVFSSEANFIEFELKLPMNNTSRTHRMRAKHSFHEYWTLKILGARDITYCNYRNQNTSPVIKSPPEPLKTMSVDVPTFLLISDTNEGRGPCMCRFQGLQKAFQRAVEL